MTKNFLYKLFARMATAAILFTPALASAGTINLAPASLTVTVGDVFQLDLTASGLNIGAYDVTFDYNPLLVMIDENLVTFDSRLGGPVNSFPSAVAGLDNLELAEVSFLTSAADLSALQSDPSYPLAHIQVKALQAGTVSFTFVSTPFTGISDYSGTPVSGVTYEGASVTILVVEPPASTVPEPSPGVFLLSGLGLLAVGRLKRRTARSDAHLESCHEASDIVEAPKED